MSSPAHWSQPSLSSPIIDSSFTHAHTQASLARVKAMKFSQRQKEIIHRDTKMHLPASCQISASPPVLTLALLCPGHLHGLIAGWRRPCCGGICLRYTGGSFSTGLLTRMCDAKLCVQSHTLALAPGLTCPTGSSYSSGH